MVCFSTYLLPLATLSCHLVAALPPAVQTLPNMKVGNLASIFDQSDKYPLPNKGNLPAHDPNILEVNNAFYLFKGGVHVPFFKASDLSGPWKQIGTVLEKDSIIPNRNNATRPWAPTTVEWKGKFYCFYSLSQAGSQKSAIGVASTDDVEKGSWKDHGALVITGNENNGSPYNLTNAIDPSFIVDQKTKTPYLNYGSYWHNLWQVPLEDDLLSVKGDTKVSLEKHLQGQNNGKGKGKGEKKHGKNDKNQHEKKNAPVNKSENDKPENDKPENDKPSNKPEGKPEGKDNHKGNQHQKQNQGKKNHDNDKKPNKKEGVQNLEATQLSFMPGQKNKPEEGSWISFKDGYYYLWFSQGKCCNFEKGFPKKGDE